MSAGTSQGANLLRGWRRLGRFDQGPATRLPEAYKKFWYEWKVKRATPVHYIPKEGMFERDEKTGIVKMVQNVPIPLQKVPEEHEGIWGGEAIIKGFQKRNPYKRRVPHFWIPTLKRSVVRSEILNNYFSMTVTERTIRLIIENHGFDHYLLKSPACDLRSELALKFKRKMLFDLSDGCPAWKDNPTRQAEIIQEYGKYLESYTPEEIEWYGLSWRDAIKKVHQIMDAEDNIIVPHKIIFRSKLIEQLKAVSIAEAQNDGIDGAGGSSWVNKINPFSKKDA